MEAVEARLEAIVDRDWKKEAAEWMERPEYDGQVCSFSSSPPSLIIDRGLIFLVRNFIYDH